MPKYFDILPKYVGILIGFIEDAPRRLVLRILAYWNSFDFIQSGILPGIGCLRNFKNVFSSTAICENIDISWFEWVKIILPLSKSNSTLSLRRLGMACPLTFEINVCPHSFLFLSGRSKSMHTQTQLHDVHGIYMLYQTLKLMSMIVFIFTIPTGRSRR